MATIFRSPLISLPTVRPDNLGARQFISVGLALLTAVALPAGKAVGRDLPAPKRDPVHSRQWVPPDRLLPLTATVLPTGKTVGWELARQKVTDSPIARSWQRVNDLPRQLAVTLPKQITDWPLPKPPRPTADTEVYPNVTVLDTVVVVTTAPFALDDWPLPKSLRTEPSDDVWTDALALNTGPAPFAQLDWPLIEPLKRRPPDATNSASLPLVTATAPFSQGDWSLSRRIISEPADDVVADSLALTAMPFSQLGWDLPKRFVPAVPDSAALDNVPINTVVVSTAPFAQFGWPLANRVDSPAARDRQKVNDLGRQTAVGLPAGKTVGLELAKRVDSPLARDRQRVNDLGRQTAVTLPARPLNWPLAVRLAPSVPQAAPLNNVPLTTVVVVTTLPFNQAAWALPLAAKVEAPEGIPANLLPLQVVPVPPVTGSSGARRLVMSIRQAIAREDFEKTVLAAYAKASGALAIPAPPKVQEAIKASIIEMIAKLPLIVRALQAGYRMADIKRVVDRAGSSPMEVEAADLPPEMQAPRREIREAEIAVRLADGDLRQAEVALAKFAKDEANAKRLEDATLKKLGADVAGSSSIVRSVQRKRDEELNRQLAAHRAKLARAQREQLMLENYRTEIRAVVAGYQQRARLAQQALVRVETFYQRGVIDDQRHKIAQAQALIDKAANVIAGLDGDDDEAITLF